MLENNIVFLFDLDGTITKEETLPLIAKHFKIEEEITQITEDTIRGNIPFVESFIRRVHILGALPAVEIDDLLSKVELSKPIVEFIQNNQDNSFIVTGNLNVWVNQLLQRIDCKYYSSY